MFVKLYVHVFPFQNKVYDVGLEFGIRFNSQRWAGLGSFVGCASACYSDGRRFDHPVRQNISHEIISTAILSISLIQVAGERLCT